MRTSKELKPKEASMCWKCIQTCDKDCSRFWMSTNDMLILNLTTTIQEYIIE
jgi:hypothetical protein